MEGCRFKGAECTWEKVPQKGLLNRVLGLGSRQLELDLVAEIKKLGIDKWNKKVRQKNYVNTSDKMLKKIDEIRH